MAHINFADGDICWTTTPYTKKALRTMPYVWMHGYRQTWSDTISSINYWYQRFKEENGGNPYKGLYLGKEVSTYRLPYFSEYHHAITQKWQENTGPAGQFAADLAKYAENVARLGLPAAGIIYPRSYSGNMAAKYSFTFYLINTCDSNGNEIAANVNKNRKFIESFITDNLHAQNNAISVEPPLIYEVYIPGIRWSPAAVVSDLQINNKGTMNLGSAVGLDPGIYTFPDAWEVNITIEELINESKAIWADAIKGAFPGQGMDIRVF